MLHSQHMKKLILFILLFALVVSTLTFAEPASQTITLKDGTILKGQLISVANNSYTIKSPTMGNVTVSADQILNINAADAQPSTSPTITSDGKLSASSVNSIKTNMMQDPQIMSLMQELAQDPAIVEILKDPSLMADALSMDPKRVENNPQVQKLIQNPTMQKILKVTAQKMQNTDGQ